MYEEDAESADEGEAGGKRKQLLIIGIAVVLVAVLVGFLLFSNGSPTNGTDQVNYSKKPTASPKPTATAVATPSVVAPTPKPSKYSFSGTIDSGFSTVYSHSTGGDSSSVTDDFAVANEGNGEQTVDVFDVVPDSVSDGSVINSSSTNFSNASKLSPSSGISKRSAKLKPKASAAIRTAISRSKKAPSPAVTHIATSDLSEEQEEAIVPLLEDLASSNLSTEENAFVEKAVNDLLNEPEKNASEKSSFEERLKAAEEFAQAMLRRQEAGLPIVSENPFQFLPEKVELKVSELTPIANFSFPIYYSGNTLLAVNGEVAELVKAARIVKNGIVEVVVSVDLSKYASQDAKVYEEDPAAVDLSKYLLPFDDKSGELLVGFPAISAVNKSIPLKLTVIHRIDGIEEPAVQADEEYFVDFPEEDPDAVVGEPETPAQPADTPVSSEPVVDACRKKGGEFAALAETFLGLPYVWGGTSLSTGVDCSGFVYALFKRFDPTTYTNIPRTASARWESKEGKIIPLEKSDINAAGLGARLIPGDNVLFCNTWKKGISHVAVYLGYGEFGNCTVIEATGGMRSGCTGTKAECMTGRVKYGNLCTAYKVSHFCGAKRMMRECYS